MPVRPIWGIWGHKGICDKFVLGGQMAYWWANKANPGKILPNDMWTRLKSTCILQASQCMLLKYKLMAIRQRWPGHASCATGLSLTTQRNGKWPHSRPHMVLIKGIQLEGLDLTLMLDQCSKILPWLSTTPTENACCRRLMNAVCRNPYQEAFSLSHSWDEPQMNSHNPSLCTQLI